MIYLITGVPGSGKSLYAISTLVQKLSSQKIKNKDGTETNRRLCVDGVTDLILPHELMAPPIELPDGSYKPGEGNGVWNWHEWCQPGDVIFIDEVQRHWRPRGMGTKPPPEIAQLETHRHKGVDFVIVTQNPMLIDQNVRRLVGGHKHVRRLFGMKRAAIYDWDGCSVDVHRTKSASMSMWSYPKSAYALYKSSELHTKQKHKIPVWLALPVLALIGGIAVAPTAFSTMRGAMTGKGVTREVSQKPPETLPVKPPAAPENSQVATTDSMQKNAPGATENSAEPDRLHPGAIEHFAGCAKYAGTCKCFTSRGDKVETKADMCMDNLPPKTGIYLANMESLNRHEVPKTIDVEAERHHGEVLAAMRQRSLNETRVTQPTATDPRIAAL